ncbi:bacteriohemerythrin [Candidatus Clostridium stratigraminis]|uniref:Bacteriohemerythrin n=1 Tax=Candidatus Clostridium stratigraminis TaxID=3381661 RepID=A0ABW8T0R7_9CLOT
MIKWNDKFSVSVAEIDNQHKQLFYLADKISSILAVNDGYDHYDEIMNTFVELKNYTLYHFDYEEKLMKKLDYTGLDSHKEEHENFINEILKLEKIDLENEQKLVMTNILSFILDWIVSHILKSDMAYKSYFNENGIV